MTRVRSCSVGSIPMGPTGRIKSNVRSARFVRSLAKDAPPRSLNPARRMEVNSIFFALRIITMSQ